MNILKIGLILLTGAGFGFGVDKLAGIEASPNTTDTYYGHMDESYCHGDGDFLEHMLEDLSAEDLVLVQAKIDGLLIQYDVTLDELYDNYEVRYDFMNDLMIFLEDNQIDFHNHQEFHGGMGMH
mgnify:FL=1